jgi:hypothetical protein
MELIDIGIYACYILLFVALITAVVFPLLQITQNPKALVKSGIGVAGLVVLFIISYALSGNEVTARYITMDVHETASKLIGAGLILFYIILIATVVIMVYSEISKALK